MKFKVGDLVMAYAPFNRMRPLKGVGRIRAIVGTQASIEFLVALDMWGVIYYLRQIADLEELCELEKACYEV